MALPYALLDGRAALDVLTAVGRVLLRPYGLRSLTPDDPAYQGDYGGGPARRDGAYHQGPVWTWLIGAYVEALARLRGDRAAALDLLRPFEHHLRDAGLGSVSEILEGDPPHQPRGAVAQAWGWPKCCASGEPWSMRMSLPEVLRLIAQTIATLVECVGVVIVAVAVVLATVRYLGGVGRAASDPTVRHRPTRTGALAGAGARVPAGRCWDILRTAVEPSWDEIGRLAAIAAIRTALNFFRQRELAAEAAMTAADAARAGGERPPAGGPWRGERYG